MVALPTPARAATFSMHKPSGPVSAYRLSAASMMARSARSLRGRRGLVWSTSVAWPAAGAWLAPAVAALTSAERTFLPFHRNGRLFSSGQVRDRVVRGNKLGGLARAGRPGRGRLGRGRLLGGRGHGRGAAGHPAQHDDGAKQGDGR